MNKSLSSRASHQKMMMTLLILSLFLFLLAAFILLKWVQQINAPILTRTWQSEDTGVVLTFTENGSVDFKEDLPSGTYHIVSPNTMEYTIEGKTFVMIYELKDKKLYWGMDKDKLEVFDYFY